MVLVSVDPGTTTCGVAVWRLGDSFNVEDLYSFTIYINGDIHLEKRLDKLYNTFRNLFSELGPYHLAHESGFINRFRPQAYGPIYASIYLIRSAYKEIVSDYGLFAYPPKMVKAVIVKGTAGKDDMYEAVMGINDVKSFITNNETEHEIDAIAIGYTHILNLREYPEILFL